MDLDRNAKIYSLNRIKNMSIEEWMKEAGEIQMKYFGYALDYGLSWLIILKKREAFRKAFDNFDPDVIKDYDEDKISLLLNNSDIVRNRSKILANIDNAKAFLRVQEEFGSFSNYIWSFTDNSVLYGDFDNLLTTNELSDKVSKDMKKRGFKYMGSVTTYSYLEAIGVMNNHSSLCYRNHGNY